MKTSVRFAFAFVATLSLGVAGAMAQPQRENLSRGVVTIHQHPPYRVAIAWQHACHQLPHPSFSLDEAAPLPKRPNLVTVVIIK